jgi:D-arabinose 1-dehydrogenase-like Zn-dependent alcohol dehydrogenase
MKAMILKGVSGFAENPAPLVSTEAPEPAPGRDIAEFLEIAAKIPLRPEVEEYPLAEANRALAEMKAGKIRGAKVLRIA